MTITIKFDQKLKQVNMMMRGNETTMKKFEYKLDQTFKIIMHAHDDACLPFFNRNIHDNPQASQLVKTKLINLHLLYNCSYLFLCMHLENFLFKVKLNITFCIKNDHNVF